MNDFSKEEKKRRAKEYQRKHQVLVLMNLILTPVLLGVILMTGLSDLWGGWAVSVPTNVAAVAIYFLCLSLFMLIFDLPTSVYGSYILEHEYGLSNHTVGSWTKDFIKKSLLSFCLSLVMIEIFYLIVRHFPETWWLIAWACFALLSYILGKLFPVFIVPLFYKYSEVANEDLKSRILDLVSHHGLAAKQVYSINLSRTTKKANAAFMGFGKTKRVVLSDTLIEGFSADEIESVVAHELGHYKHADVWKGLFFGILLSLIAFALMGKGLGRAATGLGYEGVADVRSLPLMFLFFYAFYLIVTPLQNAFSRAMERSADDFSIHAKPDRDVFISCMEKLAELNLADPDPNPVYEWFFYDHPSIAKRIARVREKR